MPVAPITRILGCIVLLFFGMCYLEAPFVSKMMSVLEAVATAVPKESVTTPSVKPTRAPALTTVPVAVSKPLESRTALR